MKFDSSLHTLPKWVEQIQARRLGYVLGIALDVLEPLGPLGAQFIWFAQPLLSVYISREMLDDIAETLEAPGGIGQLREQLEKRGDGG